MKNTSRFNLLFAFRQLDLQSLHFLIYLHLYSIRLSCLYLLATLLQLRAPSVLCTLLRGLSYQQTRCIHTLSPMQKICKQLVVLVQYICPVSPPSLVPFNTALGHAKTFDVFLPGLPIFRARLQRLIWGCHIACQPSQEACQSSIHSQVTQIPLEMKNRTLPVYSTNLAFLYIA